MKQMNFLIICHRKCGAETQDVVGMHEESSKSLCVVSGCRSSSAIFQCGKEKQNPQFEGGL